MNAIEVIENVEDKNQDAIFKRLFVKINGELKKYEVPYRTTNLVCTTLKNGYRFGRGKLIRDGYEPLGEKTVFINGRCITESNATVGIIGRDDISISEFEINIFASDQKREDWYQESIKEGRYPHPSDSALVYFDGDSRYGTSSRIGIDLHLPVHDFESLQKGIAENSLSKVIARIQFWNIYCENDDEYQVNDFNFLMRPDGKPCYGYISSFDVIYREIKLGI